jgi:hypothetical protein
MPTVPPLPEPGEQSPEDRRAMSRRFVLHAREELEQGNRLQAGEKMWGAVTQHLKLIGDLRGWRHESNRQVESVGRLIVAEYEQPDLGTALSDAYHKGHENFYENKRDSDTLREVLEEVEEIMPVLEALDFAPPRPVTITSNSRLRRLREVTGRTDLKVGDTSLVGFSLQHPEPPNGGESGPSPVTPPSPGGGPPTGSHAQAVPPDPSTQGLSTTVSL